MPAAHHAATSHRGRSDAARRAGGLAGESQSWQARRHHTAPPR
jgi:hypothetical protein